ncbi:hypothetical protein F5890DRAFT_1559842, partial [Lentinula detonsa]
ISDDIFRPSETGSDEISVFSGKTHTVTTKARTPSGRSPGSNGSARSSQSPTGSPSQTFSTTNPSFAGVHPTLVQELNTFDGHIIAQLQDAYNNHHTKFNEVLMGTRASQEISVQQQYEAEQLTRQHYEQQQRELEQRKMEEHQYMEERVMRQREEQQRAAEEEAYQRQQQHLQYSFNQSPTSESSLSIAHGVPMPAPVQHPMQDQQRTLSHSQSHPSLHRVTGYTDYNEYNEASHVPPPPSHYHHASSSQLQQSQPPRSVTHQHPQHRPSATRSHIPSHRQHHSAQPTSSHQLQHEMYAIPAEYIHQHQLTSPISSDASISPTSATPSRHHYPSPETVFETHHLQSRPQAQEDGYWPNEHHSTMVEGVAYNGHQHPARPTLQQPQRYNHGHHGHVPPPIPPTHQQYTPEAAMQGMAAEDPRLQETWTSYMYKVSSPRLMLED